MIRRPRRATPNESRYPCTNLFLSDRWQIAGSNGNRMPWENQLDPSFQQELPGFWKEHKSIIRLDVYNFLNLLNDDWGLTKQIDGFDTRYLAELGGVNPDGSYVYDLGAPADPATGEPARDRKSTRLNSSH